jgi:hypothetical protein
VRPVPAARHASPLSSSTKIWRTLPISSSGRMQYGAP